MSKKVASTGGSNFTQNKYWQFFGSFHDFFKKHFLKIFVKMHEYEIWNFLKEFLEKIIKNQISPTWLYIAKKMRKTNYFIENIYVPFHSHQCA